METKPRMMRKYIDYQPINIKEYIEWQPMDKAPISERILVKGKARCGLIDIVSGQIDNKGKFESRHINSLKPIAWMRQITDQVTAKIISNIHIEEEPDYLVIVPDDHPQN